MPIDGSLRYATLRRETHKYLISKSYKIKGQPVGIIADIVVYPEAEFEKVKSAYQLKSQSLYMAKEGNAGYEVMLVIKIIHSEMNDSYFIFKSLDEYLKDQKRLS